MDELAKAKAVRARLVTGTAWNLLATVCTQGGTFAGNVIVARVLGQTSFGEYSILQGTLVTIAGLVQLSMGYTATKYVAEYRNIDREKTERILGMCSTLTVIMAVVGTVALIALASPLAASSLDSPHLVTPLILGAGYLGFSAINGYQIGAMAGLEAYRGLANAGVMSGISSLIAVSIGAFTGGLAGAMIGLSVSAALRCGFHWVWLRAALRRSGLRPRPRGLLEERRILLHFALPGALSGYTALPALWLANRVLVKSDGGYADVALYSAAFNLMTIVMFLPAIMNNVVMSLINQQRGMKDRVGYAKLFRENLYLTGLIAALGAGGMALLGPWVLLLFGKSFPAGMTVLHVLLLSSVFEAMTIAYNQVLQSNARMWLALIAVNIPRDSTIVIGAYLLVPQFGAAGLAMAYGIGRVIGLCATAGLASSLLKTADA